MPDVVLAPQPGSQTQFLLCPAREVLYEGTRGPGKTLALLMDFLQHVGKGHGSHWRGILFRQTYPQLADVIAKTKEWFWKVFPLAEYNKADHVWTFPGGETLSLRHMASPDDYWNYHGHEYCTEVGTPVLTPSGWKRIESLRVGDSVSTPDGGVDFITRTFPVSVKPCVEASFYDDDQRLVARQVQSEDHRILASGSALEGSLSELSRTHGQFDWSSGSWLSCKSLRGARQETQEAGVSGTGLNGSSRDVNSILQAILRHLESWGSEAQRSAPALWSSVFHQMASSLLHAFGISQQPVACLPAYPLQTHFYQPHHAKQRQLFLDHLFSGASSCAQQSTRTTLGSLFGYHPSYGLRGGQPRSARAPGQGDAPSLGDAAILVRSRLLADVPGQSRINSRYDGGAFFRDPYLSSVPRFGPGYSALCEIRPCGLRETVDVTVSSGKMYITHGGIVNSNCWIGWEELTNWANAECYESMKPCNRSSHVPGPGEPPMPRKYRATCNPWGSGHGWVKARFIDPAPALTPIRDTARGWIRVRIHGDVTENEALLSADPEYLATLEQIEDESLRKAWRYGDWDIAAGGIFTDVWDPAYHVIAPFEIPSGWELSRSFDWGSSRPFSVNWWARANGEQPKDTKRTYARGTWVNIAEWYGSNGKPNQGCHMLAAEVARGILDREKQLNFRVREGVADSAIFDNGSGLSNESIATTMERLGVMWTPANKGPGSRRQGWEKMRELFVNAKRTPMEKPGLLVFETCRQFIRTVPTLLRDDKKPDDIDTDAEDHIADSVRYRIMTDVPRAGAVTLKSGWV